MLSPQTPLQSQQDEDFSFCLARLQLLSCLTQVHSSPHSVNLFFSTPTKVPAEPDQNANQATGLCWLKYRLGDTKGR